MPGIDAERRPSRGSERTVPRGVSSAGRPRGSGGIAGRRRRQRLLDLAVGAAVDHARGGLVVHREVQAERLVGLPCPSASSMPRCSGGFVLLHARPSRPSRRETKSVGGAPPRTTASTDRSTGLERMIMAKKILGYIKLQVPAGAATPSPPIGPALGQRGVNIMGFCKEFNARTENMQKGTPLPTVITVYQDKSFTFVTKTPPATYFLKEAVGHQVGLRQDRPRDRRPGDAPAAARHRREEDEGPQRQRHRGRRADHRGLGARDGPSRGGGLMTWPSKPSASSAWTGDRNVVHPLPEAIKLVKANANGQVRRDHRDRRQPGRRPAPRRPERARRRHPAVRHRPRRARRRHRQGRQGRRGHAPPGPTSSAPRTWSSASRAASWSSTA